ncbi:unnamed protein product [Darwinula stevensoni]|uniref:Uncharacterized protein n=1 Tax=Darwinula stevensoni TaxID=69355 RepID=A0A7R9A9A7_9CRUS|nr:unnamed protein product [Darwinula stevensoni]CAG0897114.1 unnamed protein product [Darwinula stevensoni]
MSSLERKLKTLTPEEKVYLIRTGEEVTEASIIADIKDRSQESEPGDESDGEQEATYLALPPSLSDANDALAIDYPVNSRELAEWFAVSKSTIHEVLTQDLQLRNEASVWVPRQLTEDNKAVRINGVTHIWGIFSREGMEASAESLWRKLNEAKGLLHLTGSSRNTKFEPRERVEAKVLRACSISESVKTVRVALGSEQSFEVTPILHDSIPSKQHTVHSQGKPASTPDAPPPPAPPHPNDEGPVETTINYNVKRPKEMDTEACENLMKEIRERGGAAKANLRPPKGRVYRHEAHQCASLNGKINRAALP